MPLSVKLSKIVGEMELQTDESSTYLDKTTGEFIYITDDRLSIDDMDDSIEEYPEWQRPEILLTEKINCDEDEQFIQLPTKFDIHEYGIMERFCLSIEAPDISDSLYSAIKGRGAFRRFKDAVYRFGIADKWYRYRMEAYKEIAITWCKDNDMKYIDDFKEKRNG